MTAGTYDVFSNLSTFVHGFICLRSETNNWRGFWARRKIQKHHPPGTQYFSHSELPLCPRVSDAQLISVCNNRRHVPQLTEQPARSGDGGAQGCVGGESAELTRCLPRLLKQLSVSFPITRTHTYTHDSLTHSLTHSLTLSLSLSLSLSVAASVTQTHTHTHTHTHRLTHKTNLKNSPQNSSDRKIQFDFSVRVRY